MITGAPEIEYLTWPQKQEPVNMFCAFESVIICCLVSVDTCLERCDLVIPEIKLYISRIVHVLSFRANTVRRAIGEIGVLGYNIAATSARQMHLKNVQF